MSASKEPRAVYGIVRPDGEPVAFGPTKDWAVCWCEKGQRVVRYVAGEVVWTRVRETHARVRR